MLTRVPVQLQQFITLILLLLAGKYLAHIYVPWIQIVTLLGVAIMIEHTFYYIKEKKIVFFSFSALSTAIGILLMLATPHFYIYVIVVFLGLLQKHFLQYEGRHFFNPSNFSLITGLILFYHSAHIVMGQMGEDILLRWMVALLGLLILYRVDRWLIPVSFILFYLFFQYWLIVSYDPVMLFETVYERFYSVSFIIFVLFMLTDPRTTPSKRWHQVFFAALIVMIATGLDRWYGFRVQHLFMALFLLSPLVPLVSLWHERKTRKALVLWSGLLVFLALGAIIYLEMQPPYYFEMEG